MQVDKSMASRDDMVVKSLSVPIGLEELMEGLTREVLLKRPADVYAFASEYFDKLLGMREKGCYKGHPAKQVRTITKKTVSARATQRPDTTATKLVLTGSNVAAQNKPNAKSKILEKRRSRRTITDEAKQTKKGRQPVVEKKDKMTQKPSIDEDGKTVDVSPQTAQKNYKNVQEEKNKARDKEKEIQASPRGAIKKQPSPRKSKEAITRKEKESGNVGPKDKSSADGKGVKQKDTPRSTKNIKEKTSEEKKQSEKGQEKDVLKKDASDHENVLKSTEKSGNVTHQDGGSNVEVKTEGKQQKQLEKKKEHASNVLQGNVKDSIKEQLKAEQVEDNGANENTLEQHQIEASINSDTKDLLEETRKAKHDATTKKELEKRQENTDTESVHKTQDIETKVQDITKSKELEKHRKEAAVDPGLNNMVLETQKIEDEANLSKDLESNHKEAGTDSEKVTQNVETTVAGKTIVKESEKHQQQTSTDTDAKKEKLERKTSVDAAERKQQLKNHQKSDSADTVETTKNVETKVQSKNMVKELDEHEEKATSSSKLEVESQKIEEEAKLSKDLESNHKEAGTDAEQTTKNVETTTANERMVKESEKDQQQTSIDEDSKKEKLETETSVDAVERIQELKNHQKSDSADTVKTTKNVETKVQSKNMVKELEEHHEEAATGPSLNNIELKTEEIEDDAKLSKELKSNHKEAGTDSAKTTENIEIKAESKIMVKELEKHEEQNLSTDADRKKDELKTERGVNNDEIRKELESNQKREDIKFIQNVETAVKHDTEVKESEKHPEAASIKPIAVNIDLKAQKQEGQDKTETEMQKVQEDIGTNQNQKMPVVDKEMGKKSDEYPGDEAASKKVELKTQIIDNEKKLEDGKDSTNAPQSTKIEERVKKLEAHQADISSDSVESSVQNVKTEVQKDEKEASGLSEMTIKAHKTKQNVQKEVSTKSEKPHQSTEKEVPKFDKEALGSNEIKIKTQEAKNDEQKKVSTKLEKSHQSAEMEVPKVEKKDQPTKASTETAKATQKIENATEKQETTHDLKEKIKEQGKENEDKNILSNKADLKKEHNKGSLEVLNVKKEVNADIQKTKKADESIATSTVQCEGKKTGIKPDITQGQLKSTLSKDKKEAESDKSEAVLNDNEFLAKSKDEIKSKKSVDAESGESIEEKVVNPQELSVVKNDIVTTDGELSANGNDSMQTSKEKSENQENAVTSKKTELKSVKKDINQLQSATESQDFIVKADGKSETQSDKAEMIPTDKQLIHDFITAERLGTVPQKPVTVKDDVETKTEVKGDPPENIKNSVGSPKILEDDKSDSNKTSTSSVEETKIIEEATSKDGLNRKSANVSKNFLQSQDSEASDKSKSTPNEETIVRKQRSISKSEESKGADVDKKIEMGSKDAINKIQVGDSGINKEDLKVIPTKSMGEVDYPPTESLDLSHPQEAITNENKNDSKIILAEEIKKPVAIVEALTKNLDDKSKSQNKPKPFKSPSEIVQPSKLDRLDKSKSFDTHTTFSLATPPPTPISSEKSKQESVDVKAITGDLLEAERTASTETKLNGYTSSYNRELLRQEINSVTVDEANKEKVEKTDKVGNIKQDAVSDGRIKRERSVGNKEELSKTVGDEEVDKHAKASKDVASANNKADSQEMLSKGMADKDVDKSNISEGELVNTKQGDVSNKGTKSEGADESKKESREIVNESIAETHPEGKVDKSKDDKAIKKSADSKEAPSKVTADDGEPKTETKEETDKNQKGDKILSKASAAKNEDTELKEKSSKIIPSDKINEKTPLSKELVAVIKIQSLFRGFLARKQLKAKSKSIQQNETITPKLLAPLQAGTQNKDLTFQKQVAAAMTIQRFWKNVMLKKRLQLKQAPKGEISFERQVRAAMTLQKFWKKIIARKHEAATKIQANVRGYLVRKDAKKLSDVEIKAALEALDNIEVPSDSPKVKNELLRSVTVEEPTIEKKHVALLGKSQSIAGFLFGPSSAPISDFKIKESDDEGIDKKLAISETHEQNVELKKADQIVEVALESKENASEEIKKVAEMVSKPETKTDDEKAVMQEQENLKKAAMEGETNSSQTVNQKPGIENGRVQEINKQLEIKENKEEDKKTKQVKLKLLENQEQSTETPRKDGKNQETKETLMEIKASKRELPSEEGKETLTTKESEQVEAELQSTVEDKLEAGEAVQESDEKTSTSTAIETKPMQIELQQNQGHSTKIPAKEEKKKDKIAESKTDKEKQTSDKRATKSKMIENKQALRSNSEKEKEKTDNKKKSQSNKSRNNSVEEGQSKPDKKPSSKSQKRRLEKSKSEEKAKVSTIKSSSFDISKLRKEIEESSTNPTKAAKTSTSFNKATIKTEESTSDSNNNHVANSKLQRSTTFTHEEMLERETPPKTLSLDEAMEAAEKPRAFCGTNHLDYENAPTRPVTSDDVETFTKERPLSMDSTTSADSVVTVVPKVDDERKADVLVIPHEDLAATKIQAAYRGHRVRRNLQQTDVDGSLDEKLKEDLVKGNEAVVEGKANDKATFEELNENGRQGLTKQKAEITLDNQILAIKHELKAATENVDKNLAATKIQSTYRGHRVRKDLKSESLKDIDEAPELESQEVTSKLLPKEVIPPNLGIQETGKEIQSTDLVTKSLQVNPQNDNKTLEESKFLEETSTSIVMNEANVEPVGKEEGKTIEEEANSKATSADSLNACSKGGFLDAKKASKTEEVEQSDDEKNASAEAKQSFEDKNSASTNSEAIVDKMSISSKSNFSDEMSVQDQKLKVEAIPSNTDMQEANKTSESTTSTQGSSVTEVSTRISSRSEAQTPQQNEEIEDKSLLKVKEPGSTDTLKQLSPQSIVESNDLKLEAVDAKLSNTDKVVTSSESNTTISKPSEDKGVAKTGSSDNVADTPTKSSSTAKKDEPLSLERTAKSFSEDALKSDQSVSKQKQKTDVIHDGEDKVNSSSQASQGGFDMDTNEKSSDGIFESDNDDQITKKSIEDSMKTMQSNVTTDVKTTDDSSEKFKKLLTTPSTEKDDVSQTLEYDAKADVERKSPKFTSEKEAKNESFGKNKSLDGENKTKIDDGDPTDKTCQVASQTSDQIVQSNDKIDEITKTSVALPSVDTQTDAKIDEKSKLSDHAKLESKNESAEELTLSSIPSDSRMDKMSNSSDTTKPKTKDEASGNESQASMSILQTDAKTNESSEHILADNATLQSAAKNESTEDSIPSLDKELKSETKTDESSNAASTATNNSEDKPFTTLEASSIKVVDSDPKVDENFKSPTNDNKLKSKVESSDSMPQPSTEDFQSEDKVDAKPMSSDILPTSSAKLETTNKSSSSVLKPSVQVVQSSSKTDGELKSSNTCSIDDPKLETAAKDNSLKIEKQSSGAVLDGKANFDEKSKSSDTEMEASTKLVQSDDKMDEHSKSSNSGIKSETSEETSAHLKQSSTEIGQSDAEVDDKRKSFNSLPTDDAEKEKEAKPSEKISIASMETNKLVEKPESFDTASTGISKFEAKRGTLMQSPAEVAEGNPKTNKESKSLDTVATDGSSLHAPMELSQVGGNEKLTSSIILPAESSKGLLQASIKTLQSDSKVDETPKSSVTMLEVNNKSSGDSSTQASMQIFVNDGKMDEKPKSSDGKDASSSEETGKVNSAEQPTEADPTTKSPSPNLVYTGELQEGAIPLAVPLDQSSAGTKELTSPTERRRRRLTAATATTTHARLKTIGDGDADDDQSAANHFTVEMEQHNKRVNSSIVKNKSVETEAATKIQASFRGYQVRKQLKQKNGSGDITTNQRRHQNKRKSSGSLSEALHDHDTRKEIEERSATKIQAGIRGFLVRKRQKNAKKSPAEAS